VVNVILKLVELLKQILHQHGFTKAGFFSVLLKTKGCQGTCTFFQKSIKTWAGMQKLGLPQLERDCL
jgi:hypothetical protein